MIGQHCMANMTNYIVQALSNLPMMAKLEDLHNHYIFIFPTLFLDVVEIILPQSPKIGLLTSTMVWTLLFFV